jgi:hypothetical protein
MLSNLLTQLPTKSNLQQLYTAKQKLSRNLQDPQCSSDIDIINQYFVKHQVKFIDLTSKKISGNSVQVIGWEHDPTLPTEEDQEVCHTMLKPAIRVGKEFIDYGQCIGSVNNPKLLKQTIVDPLPKSKINSKKIYNTFPYIRTKKL